MSSAWHSTGVCGTILGEHSVALNEFATLEDLRRHLGVQARA